MANSFRYLLLEAQKSDVVNNITLNENDKA